MQNKKHLTLDGLSGSHVLLIILTVGMTGIGLFMTKHFFQVHFPEGLSGGNLCQFSGFFSCDKATLSTLAAPFDIPLAIFGMLVGLFLLSGSFFPTREWEKTNATLSGVNALGCLFLFVYSLVVLKGLCPYCTVYYVLSWLVFALYYTHRPKKQWGFDSRIFTGYVVVGLIAMFGIRSEVQSSRTRQSLIAKDLLKQYDNEPKLPRHTYESPFYISTHQKAPVEIVLFSDFSCPACKVFSDQLNRIKKRFGKDVAINYHFYPLDKNCNTKMKYQLHPLACELAYMSICLPDQFSSLHDEFFEIQDDMSSTWIAERAKREGVTECMKSKKTRDIVLNTLENGEHYKVNSTPTYILNGVKIEGTLPDNQFFSLLKILIKRGK